MSAVILFVCSCNDAGLKLKQGAVVTKWQMTGSWSDAGNPTAIRPAGDALFLHFQDNGQFQSNIGAYSQYDHFALVGHNQIKFFTGETEGEKVTYQISSEGLEIFSKECDDCGQEFIEAEKEGVAEGNEVDQ